jgi:hypothetical protein
MHNLFLLKLTQNVSDVIPMAIRAQPQDVAWGICGKQSGNGASFIQ